MLSLNLFLLTPFSHKQGLAQEHTRPVALFDLERKKAVFFHPSSFKTTFDSHSSFVTRSPASNYTPPPPNSIHPPTSNVPTGVLMLAVIMNHFLFDRVMLAMTGAQFRHCCPLSKIKLHGWFIRFFFLTRFLLYFNYIINNVQISWYLKRRTQIGINQSSRRVLSMTDCHGVLLRSFLMSRRDFGGHPRACLEKVSRRISHA